MHSSRHNAFNFPPLDQATPEGLLAIGGDLSSGRLIEAYARGIFPWFNPGQPILWWSPDPRAVLFPAEIRISRSLGKTLRKQRFDLRMDTAFDHVIRACSSIRRAYGEGSWITTSMIDAYNELHALGLAHSVEAWCDEKLVGGLYGVAMGGVFFGESMFSRESNSSKCALAALAGYMLANDMSVIDCQIRSNHLKSLGAREIPRKDFVHLLETGLGNTLSCAPWKFTSEYLEHVL